jgi:hypothetical protein
MDSVEEITEACRSSFELAEGMRWRSYDPFDILLAGFGEGTRRRGSLPARALIYLGRRTGARVRRLVGIRPHEEAKALADFLLSSTLLSSECGCGWARSHIEPLTERLERRAVATPHGLGWGLSFPYASRFVSVAADTPNAYTTITAVSALLAAARCTGADRPLELAQAGVRAIRQDLGLVREGPRAWFRYWSHLDVCIVNIQALIAGCFQEMSALLDDPELRKEAELVAAIPLEAQNEDGSFPYATDGRGQFVDAFHTGFVLEGLTRFLAAGGAEVAVSRHALARGMEVLRSQLVTPTLLPRVALDGPAALDGQNVGQLIQTLACCGDHRDLELSLEIWRRHVPGLLPGQNADGRRGSLASLRWDAGPLVLASAHLVRQSAGVGRLVAEARS